MAWNYIINAASYRFPIVEKLVLSPVIQVVSNGKLLRKNMRKEFLTEEELMSCLWKENVTQLSEVKAAFIEGESAITIVNYSG
jgi:uncharacterized membrane protein YcaP (DUF421 family)